MSTVVNIEPWLFQTFQGDPQLVISGNRSGTLLRFPTNGSLMIFDSTVQGGFYPITPAEIVTIGAAAGGAIVASSVSLLTAKAQLLTSNGVANTVLNPPGVTGYVLRYNPATSTGLEWVAPSSTSGTVAPVASTIVQRDTPVARIFGEGFVTSGDVLPDTTNTRAIGAAGNVFSGVFSTGVTATTVTTATVTSVASLTVGSASGSTVILAPGGTTLMTLNGTTGIATVAAGKQIATPSLIIGTYQATGSWIITTNGSNQLSLKSWNGAAYVEVTAFG